MKKILLSLFVCTSISSFSQELETILLAREDAAKITDAYLQPAFKGFIYSMNNGWYHTAKVHKKFGFDITIGASASLVPEKEEIFDLSTIGLSNSTRFDRNLTPTVAGDSDTPATITYESTVAGQNVSASFQMPNGIKEDLPLNSVPAPSIQVGVGLPFKLDAMVRYTPKVGSDDVKGSIFGFGLKKEITDWFGIVGKTPLHISILAAYSNMNVDYVIGDVNEQEISTRNALTEFKLNAYTFQAIASLNLPIINFYGGLGFNSGNTTLNMLGDYTLRYNTGNPVLPTVEETITDPFSLSESASSFNATIGTRISLGFFKIFGSYTLQEYGSINAGIAFSFR
ncbi:DUF6588 family protein [Tenacibaculum jejuense]|uniref:Uncharacterized protein n=1 Tax=Tenacibaculum jejuense TaxID=584609 RepID=A0A238UCJ8_9FLAO|nr:DUF6588 family protein [Tenacibaculum jejuense]SNR16822.1 Protein of unknown function precursor [Tenacibaculum jejuense]